MAESMNRCQSSPLFRFLSSLWGEDETMRLFRLYNVGATSRMNDATVFWQTDINGCIRTGKVMRYGNDGHRIKEDGLVNFMWAHRMKSMVDNPEDFNLVQCFFGEHLLSVYPDSKVMIVESEKSAIIASHYYPQYLWMASGGCCGCLNQTASQVLKGREVWLVPDLDAEDRWRDKLAMLRTITPTAGIVTAISDMATPEQRAAKLDIADFLLDTASRNNPIVGVDDGANQLAECRGILVIKFRKLLWHFHPKSPTSPEKAISHRATSRLSFAIDTEFYHNHFNSRVNDNTICSVPPGAWRRQRFEDVMPHRAQDRRRQTSHP